MGLTYDQGSNPTNGSTPSEAEIGTIIVEAQRFADETALQARRAADALIRDAQASEQPRPERITPRRGSSPPQAAARGQLALPVPGGGRPSGRHHRGFVPHQPGRLSRS